MHLSFKYRLLPTRKQHAALAHILEGQRLLYNAALEERIGAYRRAGKAVSFAAQSRALTECRREIPYMGTVQRTIQEDTLKRLDLAFAAFFRRVKAGQKPGFPRFRSKDRWRSFTVRQQYGMSLVGRRLKFKGLPGSIRFHQHRPLPSDSEPTMAVIRKDAKGWSISFIVMAIASPAHDREQAIGIDVGLNSMATLSNGEIIPNPRIARRAQKEIRRRQRALSRCKKGSGRRLKVKASLERSHRKIVNTRATHLHQVSASLARDYQTIVVERLNIRGMVRSTMARDIHDAAWSIFKFMLAYKAERAGGQLIEVDPKFTSQDCSGCGERVPKTLSVREHSCPSCGLTLNRDHNAALNILHKAKLGLESGNVAQWSERRPRNIGSVA